MSARCQVWTVIAAVTVAGTFAADAAAEEVTPAVPIVRRVIVSIADRQLVVVENGEAVEWYAVAVGADATPSPVGTFTIVNRITDPTYYRPGKVVPPGPGNPLGTRWIGLSQKGYGIHGTDVPQSIGKARSQGCIRLRNADLERLFERVRPGDVVELHAERTPGIESYFTPVTVVRASTVAAR